jgi:hypothetical protein
MTIEKLKEAIIGKEKEPVKMTTIAIPPRPNELLFVDEDIKNEFEGKSYFIGVPTQIQLARNIKKLTDLLTA